MTCIFVFWAGCVLVNMYDCKNVCRFRETHESIESPKLSCKPCCDTNVFFARFPVVWSKISKGKINIIIESKDQQLLGRKFNIHHLKNCMLR